jgi:hypothetical protein
MDTGAQPTENIEDNRQLWMGGNGMYRLLALALFLCVFSSTLIANDLPVSALPAAPASPSSNPAPTEYVYIPTWQLAAGFQFQHYNVFGASFANYGYHADITRTLTNWGSLEGIVATGFGHSGGVRNPEAKSLFVGGGPRFTARTQRLFEPWMHVLVGMDRLASGVAGSGTAPSSLAFMGGVGADLKFNPRIYLRVEGDYLGTQFQSTPESNISVGTSVVFNF